MKTRIYATPAVKGLNKMSPISMIRINLPLAIFVHLFWLTSAWITHMVIFVMIVSGVQLLY